MRTIHVIAAAVLLAGLASPTLAQTDPHHPEDDGAPAVEAPADNSEGSAMVGCPPMMGGMMGGMMQPSQDGSQQLQMMQTQMMQMMGMMQMMQQTQLQLMQQMQRGGMPMPDSSQGEVSP